MFTENKDINAVIIVTPEFAHFEPVREAVDAGVNILLEKPVAMDMGEARQIVSLCNQAGITLGICHHMRFDPRDAAVHDFIASGEIGDIVHIFSRTQLA